jgi:hypothetical protein
MTPELKVAVVSSQSALFAGRQANSVFFSSVQRFAETRLSDLICSNEALALEFEVYGKNAITREPLPFSFSQKTGSLTFRRR